MIRVKVSVVVQLARGNMEDTGKIGFKKRRLFLVLYWIF